MRVRERGDVTIRVDLFAACARRYLDRFLDESESLLALVAQLAVQRDRDPRLGPPLVCAEQVVREPIQIARRAPLSHQRGVVVHHVEIEVVAHARFIEIVLRLVELVEVEVDFGELQQDVQVVRKVVLERHEVLYRRRVLVAVDAHVARDVILHPRTREGRGVSAAPERSGRPLAAERGRRRASSGRGIACARAITHTRRGRARAPAVGAAASAACAWGGGRDGGGRGAAVATPAGRRRSSVIAGSARPCPERTA